MTVTTTTSAMTLPEQLVALARVNSLPYHHRKESMRRYDPSSAGGAVRELIEMLCAVGIPPTDLAKFNELSAITYPTPVAPPGRRLDMSPADFQQRIIDLALAGAVREVASRSRTHEGDVLHQELLDSMRAEAGSYIDALRLPFEVAIGDFREAIELGITMESTDRSVMDMGSEVIKVWRQITGPKGMAEVLEGIAGLRIRTSLALGVPPVNRYSGEAALLYGTAFGAGATFDQFTGWRRWLSIASTGNARLVGLDELA